MKRLWSLVLCTPVLFAGPIPGRYIVELDRKPLADEIRLSGLPHAARRTAITAAGLKTQRQQIQLQQTQVRRALENTSARVVASFNTLLNALVVTIPDSDAQKLNALPGVRRVYQAREVRRHLDHAVALHRATDVWSQIGMDRAGLGVKVGILDSGIDATHPGFQDSALPLPDGFPKVNNDSDIAFTNNKIIVARSYVDRLGPDTDISAADDVGHGTFVAMIVAGNTNQAPLAPITGMAPKAYLGNYKVFGSPGLNDSTSDDVILAALEDALLDGMDIVNLSLGAPLPPQLGDDLEVSAVERASYLGMLVVVSAGNSGPDPTTLESPGTAPSALTVGAMYNSRLFLAPVAVNGTTYPATPGQGSTDHAAITANLVDVQTLDPTGQACSKLPANSLDGKTALILRGVCLFENKLNNVMAAGAVAAIVYTNDRPITVMAVGAATLPAVMTSNSDGLAIQQQIASGNAAGSTVGFSLSAFPGESRRMAAFSSAGPNVDSSIKPDLAAVGVNVYSAAQRGNTSGELFSASGYLQGDGTSFSAPMVSGALALLKSARPGLTSRQYRSLIIDNAAPFLFPDGTQAHLQQAGAGSLDVFAAYSARIAAYPAALNFGIGSSLSAQTITLSNLAAEDDTFTLAFAAIDGSAVPVSDASTVTLAQGAQIDVSSSFANAPLPVGLYEGYLKITSAKTGAETRVPYWYAISGDPQQVSVLAQGALRPAGRVTSGILTFRITDSSGVPLPDFNPLVTVVDGDGRITDVRSIGFYSPGAYQVDYRAGSAAVQSIQVKAGGAVRLITLN